MLARLMWEEKVGGPDLSSQKNKGEKGREKKGATDGYPGC